jgi:MYXO-CTERM domain-containing protein
MAYSRRLGATIPLDADPVLQPAAWMRLSPDAARRLARLTRHIEPFPARRLEAARAAESARADDSGDSLPPETYRSPGAEESDDEDGVPAPLLAGAPLALLAGLGIAGWRRRR